MFKISEFSKLAQVSVKTLHYYDQLDLFKPAHTDIMSGYRYYTADQLFQLNRIRAFKELGFTLTQIQKLLAEDIPMERIHGMFQLKQAELQAELERKQARLTCVEELLVQIEKEGMIETKHDVVLKNIAPESIVSLRQQSPIRKVHDLFRQLDERFNYRITSTDQPMVLWHGCEECEEAIDLEVAYRIQKPAVNQENMRHLPAAPIMATLVHRCQLSRPCTVSTDLALWIGNNGYRIKENEPRREIYLQPVPEHKDTYIAEVQIPVEKVTNT